MTRSALAVTICCAALAGSARAESSLERRSARAANLLLTGLVSSVPLFTEVFYNPATAQMSGPEYTAFMNTHLGVASKVMPVTMLVTLASYAPLLAFDRERPTRPAFLLALGSAVLLAAAIVVTIITEAPLDAAFVNASASSPPANWEQVRAGWIGTQPLRTGFAVSASLTALAAMVVDD